MNLHGLTQTAANIVDSENPPFTAEDFRSLMPAFSTEIVSDAVLQHYIDQANAIVKEARWHELWKEGMRLCIAHFLVLHLQTNPPPDAGRMGIVNAGGVNGVATSKSVGGVSVSYDINVANGDLTGWAAWKLTVYGTQFATMAQLLGKGGMYVR